MSEELTLGEQRIIRAIMKLEKEFIKYGQNLILFNGNSLRKGGQSHKYEIRTFPGIIGSGGDGGDDFD